jgi:hypothetical protein
MPNKRLPVYRLVIDENTEGMDFMGLVDYPAHGKNWMTFAQLPVKVEQKYAFNEEKTDSHRRSDCNEFANIPERSKWF